MVRWLRWHCPPDTGFEIRALAVWGRARYLSVTEAPHNTNFHTWMGKKQFCFFQTAETGNRTPDSGVKGSGANHYPRAPAQVIDRVLPILKVKLLIHLWDKKKDTLFLVWYFSIKTNHEHQNGCWWIYPPPFGLLHILYSSGAECTNQRFGQTPEVSRGYIWKTKYPVCTMRG